MPSPLIPIVLGGAAAALLLGSQSSSSGSTTGGNSSTTDSGGSGGKPVPPVDKAGPVVLTDAYGVPVVTPPATVATKGKPSNPLFQWKYVVKAGDNPSRITKGFVGDDRRFVELIAANPSKATVGNAANPYSSGYNFKSLVAGEKLLVPKAWNAWIDEEGNQKGTPTPWGEIDV